MTPPDNRFAAPATAPLPLPLPLPLRILPLLRQLLPLALGLACLWLLAQKLQDFDLAALRTAFGAIPLGGWAGALLATGLSFWAVGRYDAVIHRHLRTGIGDGMATRAGMCSIALAQTLGFGIITGSLARWRALPRISLAQSAQISVLVAVSFLAGLAVLLGISALLLPMPSLAKPFVFLPLLLAPLVVALALLRPVLRLPGGRRLALPSLLAMAEIFWLTLLDTLAACAALYLLLPGDAGITLAQLYPVFLLALGAALLSGTPGGVGPFELALLALLPHSPEPALLAGVLGFRLVYYALPASLALLVLLARPAAPPARSTVCPCSINATPATQ